MNCRFQWLSFVGFALVFVASVCQAHRVQRLLDDSQPHVKTTNSQSSGRVRTSSPQKRLSMFLLASNPLVPARMIRRNFVGGLHPQTLGRHSDLSMQFNHALDNLAIPLWIQDSLANPASMDEKSLQRDVQKVLDVLKDSLLILHKEPQWDIFADNFTVSDMTGAKVEGLEHVKLLFDILRRIHQKYSVKDEIEIRIDPFLEPFRKLHPGRKPYLLVRWNIKLDGQWAHQLPFLPADIDVSTVFGLNDRCKIESMHIQKWHRSATQKKFLKWSHDIKEFSKSNSSVFLGERDVGSDWLREMWLRKRMDEVDEERISWMRTGRV